MKKAAIYALGIAAITLASCGKKDAATLRELDGTWKLTKQSSISNEISYEDNDIDEKEDFVIESTRESLTIDKTTYDYVGDVFYPTEIQYNGEISKEITFDRKAGTYEITIEQDVESVTSITPSGEIGVYGSRTINEKTETIEEGTFYINDKVGDTKGGTYLILIPETIEAHTVKDVKSVYTSDFGGHEAGDLTLETYDVTSIEEVEGESGAKVIKINSASKKELVIEFNIESTSLNTYITTRDGDSDTYKTRTEITTEAKETYEKQ